MYQVISPMRIKTFATLKQAEAHAKAGLKPIAAQGRGRKIVTKKVKGDKFISVQTAHGRTITGCRIHLAK